MFKKLKNKLVITYSIIIIVILTVMTVSLFIVNEYQLNGKFEDDFQHQADNIVNGSKDIIDISSNNSESILGADDYFLYVIDTSGVEQYVSSLNTINTDFNEENVTNLVNSAIDKLNDENIYPCGGKVTYGESGVIQVDNGDGYKYYCKCNVIRKNIQSYISLDGVNLVPYNAKYRALIVFKRINEENHIKLNYRYIYLCVYLVVIVLVVLVSNALVTKALEPMSENDKRQKEFIAAASHELKSPLAVIKANAEALESESADIHYSSAIINKECSRMSRLIEDLLLLASSEAGKWNIEKKLFESDTLLINIFDKYQPIYSSCGRKLSLDIPDEELPEINGDCERIEQVIGILLDNSLAYAGKDSYGIIKAYCEKSRLIIEVIDNGIGIDDQHKSHIFDKFYRVDNSRKDKLHFGLGLSIAYELIRLHNGSISVKDTPGGGTTFLIVI